jgi:hypothetical protein
MNELAGSWQWQLAFSDCWLVQSAALAVAGQVLNAKCYNQHHAR